jgi:ribonuclease BN (tRNA processing enzyme)
MDIELLGAHNCESQDTRFVSLLIDGALALDAGGLTSNLSFDEQLGLEALLLTHQHYDHVRDVPAIAMNYYLAGGVLDIYSTDVVQEVLASLMNGGLYPAFLERPPGKPTINFNAVETGKAFQIGGYAVLPVAVNHGVPGIGYQVASPDGNSVFYTGDTGPGLADCWKLISPKMLVIEVTATNQYEDFAREAGHLTPGLLKEELTLFHGLKGYLPEVVIVHMSPGLEDEIAAEIDEVSENLDAPITLGHEGMYITL